jgi:hypothetical protein
MKLSIHFTRLPPHEDPVNPNVKPIPEAYHRYYRIDTTSLNERYMTGTCSIERIEHLAK